jgi:large subunit ribosomal protein L10
MELSMPQKYKIERVQTLKDGLKGYRNYIFTNYRGLNVAQINSLRNSLREKGVEFHVVKNRFVKRVFNELGMDGFDQYLIDPTALAYFNTDISDVSKILIDMSEETTLEIKGGYSEGSLLSTEEIEKISRLPSKESLIAQAVGLLNAPQRGIVMVLSGVLQKFVRTLKAIEANLSRTKPAT